MTIHLGDVPANSTLYIPFATYGKTNGESITLTGLAVTDIEVYKNGSVTQRSSDAGFALLDTDGIDFDGITGIHGFSIDLSDNTDAGFYAVGSFYWVVVSSVTIDSQTVNFIAATFRIVAAEAIAGKPKVDVDGWNGTAVATPDTAGYPKVTVKSGSGTGELDVTSGVVKSNLAQILGTALTETSGQIAAAFKQFFNVASPTGTMKQITLVDTVTTLTNAPSDSSGVTTLLTRLSATRAGYLDNLSAGAVALEATAQSILTKLLKYVQLIVRKDAAIATDNATELTAINANGGSGAGAFANTTDAQEAIRDNMGTAQTGDSYARLGAPAGASVSADVAAVKAETAAIVDDTGTSGVVVAAASKTGYRLSAAGVQDIWDALTSALTTASSIGKLLVDNINATISSRLASSSYTAPLDAVGTRSAVGLASANLDTQLAALPTAAENADALLGRNLAGGSSTGRTVKQALRALRNKVTIAGGTITVYQEDDATSDWTAAATTDATADPITEVDPA